MKMKRLFVVMLVLGVLLLLSGCCINHEWQDATCTLPVTCAKCEKTEGEPLGHTWKEATCTTPKTCEVCGETEGEPAAHISGDWERDDPDYVTTVVWERKYCTVCGTQTDTQLAGGLPSLVDDDVFLFSPEEFGERLCLVLNTVNKELGDPVKEYEVEIEDIGDTLFFYHILEGSEEVLGGILASEKPMEKTSNNAVNHIFTTFSKEDDYFANHMMAVLITCDPSIKSVADSGEIAQNIVGRALSSKVYQRNGVLYTASLTDDGSLAMIAMPH